MGIESVAVSVGITGCVIYFWLKVFHERASILRVLAVALIANFQNYVVPMITGVLMKFGIAISYPFLVIPAVFWILLIKLFFREVPWSHAIVIGVLCFATHTVLELYIPRFAL